MIREPLPRLSLTLSLGLSASFFEDGLLDLVILTLPPSCEAGTGLVSKQNGCHELSLVVIEVDVCLVKFARSFLRQVF